MFIKEIINQLRQHKPGNRAVVTRAIRNAVLDNNKEQQFAEIILEQVALGVICETPILKIGNHITKRISNILELSLHSYLEGEKHSAGIKFIDYLGQFIAPEVRECIRKDGNVEYQTVLKSTDDDFQKYAESIVEEDVEPLIDPTTGPKTWTSFRMNLGEGKYLDLVKKADRFQMRQHYKYSDMPLVYDAINRLQQTPFEINTWLLDVANQLTHIFTPAVVEDETKTKSLRSIARMKKRARQSNSLQQLEESDWYAAQFEVVSNWSKRKAFEATLRKANKWKDDTLHFTYTLDTRSRMYAMTSYLNPQDSDFAKGLLVFNNKRKLDKQVLAVVTANHSGNDKISFEDRVQWVEDNIDDLYNIGANPFSERAIKFIKDNEIQDETKSRWQFLACCREWYNIIEWIENGNDIEDYMTNIVSALDASCSALQIATVISRDENLAPYVNLVETDKPGDIYKLSGEELQIEVKKLAASELTPGLQQIIDHSSIRKVAKRPQMVADYSGTMQGMKAMTYQERKKNKIPAASKKDCNKIGEILFNVTNHDSRGSTKIKKFLRSGVKFHKGGAMLKWKTIDNFTCFQVADRSKEGTAVGSIGGIKVSLKYYMFQDVKNIQKHQNMLCPNVTHSIDASIVRYIVTGLPKGTQLAMVHDSYGTSSDDTHLLLPLVKEALTIIGDREWYENMVADMFDHHRTLPTAGKLTIDDIQKSIYAIG